MADSHCSTCGIDSTGNSIPDSMTTGMSSTIAESNNATSCVFATLDMSNPRERANSIYKVLTARIQNSEPASGTSSTKRAISRMVMRMAKASTK